MGHLELTDTGLLDLDAILKGVNGRYGADSFTALM